MEALGAPRQAAHVSAHTGAIQDSQPHTLTWLGIMGSHIDVPSIIET